MVKLSIVSGFLGAGKTTFIKKLVGDCVFGDTPFLVENDYGSLGIDSALMASSGLQVKEITAGCICCSVVGSFVLALEDLIREQEPEHIIIEPSGIAKLSEILESLKDLSVPFERHLVLTVVDAKKFFYNDEFVNEYFWNQIRSADAVVLSKTKKMSAKELDAICRAVENDREPVPVICVPWETDFNPILKNVQPRYQIVPNIKHSPKLMRPASKNASAGQGLSRLSQSSNSFSLLGDVSAQGEKPMGIWESFSAVPSGQYDRAKLEHILAVLGQQSEYGTILRGKGIFSTPEGTMLLNYVSGDGELTLLPEEESSRVFVVGTHLNYENLSKLFQ